MKRYNVPGFWDRVEKTDTCWVWTRGKCNGYGVYRHAGQHYRAHRWSWQEVNGPVPDGLELDHLCRNRACVRPSHLEAVTRRTNALRGVGPTAVNAKKQKCLRGHEYQYDPTTNRRKCPACATYLASISPHGTTRRYTRGGCRCDECRQAKAEYHRSWSARRKQPVTFYPEVGE